MLVAILNVNKNNYLKLHGNKGTSFIGNYSRLLCKGWWKTAIGRGGLLGGLVSHSLFGLCRLFTAIALISSYKKKKYVKIFKKKFKDYLAIRIINLIVDILKYFQLAN